MPHDPSAVGTIRKALPALTFAGAVVVAMNLTHFVPFQGWFRPANQWFYPILRSCEEYRSVFAEPNIFAGSDDAIDQLTTEYEGTLKSLLAEYAPAAGDPAAPLNPQCTVDNPTGLLPNSALNGIAAKLPPWKDGETEGKLAGPILLEYLHAYECALIDRSTLLPIIVYQEESKRYQECKDGKDNDLDSKVDTDDSDCTSADDPSEREVERTLDAGKYGLEFWDQMAKIPAQSNKERQFMNRLQPLLAGLERVRMVDGELTCLTRGSLDIRNAFALSAEISSCLPRIWNAKDPLRDPQPLPVTNP